MNFEAEWEWGSEKELLKNTIDEQMRDHIVDLGDDGRSEMIEEQLRRLGEIENERYR